MPRDPLLRLPATELARLIRAREVTSRGVVESHIEQIRRVNPVLNAVVRDRFADALAEADEADRLGPPDDPAERPLHGVPCTIKECFALRGMPNSSGLVARADLISDSDATTVARLRGAGAIPLGVTNLSELCMWMESANQVYGRTRNPYDPTRIVGGSSGGEGAIVGAGGSPFGLGSDIGGSIRMPAFFNGVFGHKPTGGLVPGSGQYPMPGERGMRFLTTGPIARRAADLMPLLRILAGPDGADTGCAEIPLGDPAAVELSRLRVVDVADDGFVPVDARLRDAQRRAAQHLASRGARVEQVRVAGLRRSIEIWGTMLADAGGEPFSELLGNGTDRRWSFELLRWAAGASPHTLPSIVLAIIEPAFRASPKRTRKILDLGLELRHELVRLVGPDGVMLYPSHSRPAPRHGRPLLRPWHWIYTAILNVMEMPATQIPLGLDERGLPLGIQVAAAHGNDHMTIAVALELERAFGGWVPPALARG